MPLPRALRELATTAFRDNSKLAVMSDEDRECLAQWYEELSQLAVTRGAVDSHVFREGETVTLSAGISFQDVKSGDRGVVRALYDTQPPAYEVTWATSGGDAFDATMYEDELATLPLVAPERKVP